jgi:hypothetical protein
VVSFTPRPLYPLGKSPRYPLDRRPDGSLSRREPTSYLNLHIESLSDAPLTPYGLSRYYKRRISAEDDSCPGRPSLGQTANSVVGVCNKIRSVGRSGGRSVSQSVSQSLTHPEGGGSKVLRNDGILPQHYTALRPRIRRHEPGALFRYSEMY